MLDVAASFSYTFQTRDTMPLITDVVPVSDLRLRHPPDEEPQAGAAGGQLQPQHEDRTRAGGRTFPLRRPRVALLFVTATIDVSSRWRQAFSNTCPVRLTRRSKWA